VQSKNPLRDLGIVRHVDLGRAGGGHSGPTQDRALWRSFLKLVGRELGRSAFRNSCGRSAFKTIGS
jgi:hypothetical protein